MRQRGRMRETNTCRSTTAEGTAVAENLEQLHGNGHANGHGAAAEPEFCVKDSPEVLYHMTSAAEWTAAKEAGAALFPATFEEDGFFTHATGVPKRLVSTANHFYQGVPGAWVCLQFRRSALKRCGIIVRDEEALPVGSQAVDPTWVEKKWVCPHVVGGIPVHVVERVYEMTRAGAAFTGIEGLEM